MQRKSADKQSSIADGTASRRQKKILSKLREIYLKSVCFAAMKVDGYINEAAVVSRLPEWEDEQAIIKAALQTFNKEASEWIEQEGNVAKLLALTLEAWLIIIELRDLFYALKFASETKEGSSLATLVKIFLAKRAQRIRGTDFAYTHSPDHDSRFFSYSLFKELAELIAPEFKTTAVELLIPTLRMKKNIYGISISELDLRRCELDEKDESLIDVAACLEAAGPEGKYYLQIEGPVQPELTPDVRKRVTEHSKEAKECHAAIEAVLECKRKGANLGAQIFRLQERLQQGGVHGNRGGEETKAGGDAYKGIADFYQFLKGLEDEHREIIFKLTSASLTVAPNFKIIWYRLLIRAVFDNKISIPETEQKEILEELERHPTTQLPCSELIAGNIEVILNDNKNIFNIFSGKSEAVQESKAEQESEAVQVAVGILDYQREEKQQALFAAMAKPSYQVTATYGEDATKIFLRRLLVNQELLDMVLKATWNLDEFILILTSLDITRVDDYLNKLNDGFFLGLFENRNYLIKIFNALFQWPDLLQEKFLARVGMLCSLSVTNANQLLEIFGSLQDNAKMKFLCCFSRLSLNKMIDESGQGVKLLTFLLAKLPSSNHQAFLTLLGNDQLKKLIKNIDQLLNVLCLSKINPANWPSFLNCLGRAHVIELFSKTMNYHAVEMLNENHILFVYLGEDLRQIIRDTSRLVYLLTLSDHATAGITFVNLGIDHVTRLVPDFEALMNLLTSVDQSRRLPTLTLFGANFLPSIMSNSLQLKRILSLLPKTEQKKSIYKLLGETHLVRILQTSSQLESCSKHFDLFLDVLDSISVERRMEFLTLFQRDYLCRIIKNHARFCIVLNRLPSRHELNFIKHVGDNHVRRVINDNYKLSSLLSGLNDYHTWQRVFQIVDVDPTRPNSIINDVTQLHQALVQLTTKEDRTHFLELLGEDVTNSLLLKENYKDTLRKIEACPNADIRNQLYLALTRAYRSQRLLQGEYKTCWGRFFSCVGKGYHKNAKLNAARRFEDAIASGEDILAVGALNDGDLGMIVKSYRLSRRQSR